MMRITTSYFPKIGQVPLPDLSVLSGLNILVTGASGLVGSTVTELLALNAKHYGYHVYAGCRKASGYLAFVTNHYSNVHIVNQDVTYPLEGDTCHHYIVNCASGASPAAFEKTPVEVMMANILGTKNLLDYGRYHKMKKFVLVSTGEIYGHGCGESWSETDVGQILTMNYRSCYPESKRAAETLVCAYAHEYGVNGSVARLCHTYGPNYTDKDNRAYAQFLRNAVKGEDICLNSPGLQHRSWIYVLDSAAAIVYIMINGGSCEAYNVANENSTVSIREFAEVIASLSGVKVIINTDAISDKGAITKAVFDTTKIRNLGWAPIYGIKGALSESINALKPIG